MRTHLRYPGGRGALCRVWGQRSYVPPLLTDDLSRVTCRACLKKVQGGRMGVPANPPPAEAIELSVRLVSGGFESRVQLPVAASSTQRKALVTAWLNLIERALEIARSRKGGR